MLLTLAFVLIAIPPHEIALDDQQDEDNQNQDERLEPGTRVRVGLDFGATAGVAIASRCIDGPCAGVLAPTLALDLGVQLDRRWAVMGRAEVGSLAVSSFAQVAAMVEGTPDRAVSLGVGLGMEGVDLFDFFGGDDYWGPVVPLRLSLNFLDEAEWSAPGRNSAWRLTLAVVPGYAFEDELFTIRAALGVGFVWM